MFVVALLLAGGAVFFIGGVDATAAPVINASDITVTVNGTSPVPQAVPLAHIGDKLQFDVVVTNPSGVKCPGTAVGGATPQETANDVYHITGVTADSTDVAKISAGTLTMAKGADENHWSGQITIDPRSAAAGDDGDSTGISVRFTAHAACTLTLTAPSTTQADPNNGEQASAPTASPAFRIDNVLPSSSFTVACTSNLCNIGSTMTIALTTPVGVTTATADVRRIGGTQTSSLSTAAGGTGYPVGETASTDAISVSVHDASTNSVPADLSGTIPTLDTVRPASPTALSVVATGSNNLRIQFTPSASTDVPASLGTTGYQIFEQTTGNAGSSVNANSRATYVSGSVASPPLVYLLAPGAPPAFASGSSVDISVQATDSNGNAQAPPLPTQTVTLTASAPTVAITTPTGTAGAFLRDITTIGGTWSGTGTPTISVALTRMNGGTKEFWTGSAWSTVATDGFVTASRVDSPQQTWSTSAARFAAAAPGGGVADGDYAIEVRTSANDVTAPLSTTTLAIKLDQTAPVLDPGTAGNVITKVSGADVGSPTAGAAQGTTADYLVKATDGTGAGVTGVSFQFFAGTPLAAVSSIDGTPSIAQCLPAPTVRCTMTAFSNGQATAHITLPDVKFGNYTLRMTVTDAVGNVATIDTDRSQLTNGKTVWVQPRLVWRDTTDSPFYDGAGVNLYVYGSYGSTSRLDTSAACPSNVCKLSGLEIYGRNVADAATTAINTAKTPLLKNVDTAEASASTLPAAYTDLAANTLPYYNYSVRLDDLKGRTATAMQVYIRAIVNEGATKHEVGSGWINVRTANAAGQLAFTGPANWTVFADTINNTAKFNLTFEKIVDETPTLSYQIWKISDDRSTATPVTGGTFNATMSSVGPTAAASATGAVAMPVTDFTKVTRWYFNWSNTAALGSTSGPAGNGLYYLEAKVVGKVQSQPITSTNGIYFAVEDRQPHLDLAVAQPDIYGGSYVRPVFNVTYNLYTGYQNVTGLSRLSVQLNTTRDASSGRWTMSNGSGFTFWANGTTFDPALARATPNDPYWGNVTIALPANATAASVYDIYLNVTTDSVNTGGGWSCIWKSPGTGATTKPCALGFTLTDPKVNGRWVANASAVRSVQIDRTPPTTALTLSHVTVNCSSSVGCGTVDSGNDTTGELRIVGTAVEPQIGSGVKTVYVRIVDMNATDGPAIYDPTANRGFGDFVPTTLSTLPDKWLSSSPVNMTASGLMAPEIRGNATCDVIYYPSNFTWVLHVNNAKGRTLYDRVLVKPTKSCFDLATSTDAADPPAFFNGNVFFGFNRSHTFQIDSKAVDALGNEGAIRTQLVVFDATPPTLGSNFGLVPVSGQTANTIGWHGSRDNQGHGGYGNFTVTVGDNQCVAKVLMTGITPSGQRVPPGEFLPDTSAGAITNRCPAAATTYGLSQIWYLNVSQMGNVTDEIGTYHYSVDAYDATGNLVRSTINRTVTVLDTLAPTVTDVKLDPPGKIAPGTRSTVLATVFENYRIDHLTATLQRLTPQSSVDPTFVDANGEPYSAAMIPVTVDPVNGTGVYTARSDVELAIANLTEGTYIWSIRAYDTNPGNCNPDCVANQHPLQIVSSAAPTQVVLDAPVAGSTFVNASPTFTWRVLDRSVQTSQITLKAGPTGGTLTTVTPTFSQLAPVGSTATGYQVTYRPNLAGKANWSVNLSVATDSPTYSAANFTVDGVGPQVTATVTGDVLVDGVRYATAGSRVVIAAIDNETTIASLTYSINGATAVAYAAPLVPTGPDGAWTLDATATDAAGNAATTHVAVMLDATRPTIQLASQPGDSLLVTVSDAAGGAGLDETNVTVHYVYGGGSTYTALKMTKAVGNSFSATLPGDAKKDGLAFFFDAKDRAGNIGSLNSSGNPIRVEANAPPPNAPPTIGITAPAAGSSHAGGVDVVYTAADTDSTDLTITIALREPTGPGTVLVQNGSNTGQYHADLAGKSPGEYTIVVTVTDGHTPVSDEVTFTIPQPTPTPPTPSPPKCDSCPKAPVPSGTETTFNVSFANPTVVDHATYRVRLNGVDVANGTLAKDANGAYSFDYTPTKAGTYQVYVRSFDSAGKASGETALSTFSVAGAPDTGPAPTHAMPTSLLVLLAVAVLTVALAAYGAFLRWK